MYAGGRSCGPLTPKTGVRVPLGTPVFFEGLAETGAFFAKTSVVCGGGREGAPAPYRRRPFSARPMLIYRAAISRRRRPSLGIACLTISEQSGLTLGPVPGNHSAHICFPLLSVNYSGNYSVNYSGNYSGAGKC